MHARGGRIAGAVGQEDAGRLQRQDLVKRRRGRHHRHARAGGDEVAQDVALHAIINGHNVRAIRVAAVHGIAAGQRPQSIIPSIILGGADHAGEVHAFQARPRLGLAQQFLHIELAGLVVSDHAVGGAAFTDALGERAGINAADANAAPRLHPVIKAALRPEIGGRRHGFAHHAAKGVRVGGFDILVIGAHIADVREGEGDDLPGIAGVAHHFLITGHCGVEADFAHRHAFGTETMAPDDAAIGQNQYPRRAFGLGGRRGGGHGQVPSGCGQTAGDLGV